MAGNDVDSHERERKNHQEHVLLNRVRAGDKHAFAELVRQYLDVLVRFGVSLTGSQDIAQDIVQDVFIAIWLKGESWVPKSTVAAYLFTAVRNRARDIVKVDLNRQRLELEMMQDRPVSHAEDDLFAQEVKRAVLTLTVRQQEAVRLRYERGLTIAEVAEILGLDLRATRRLLGRALENLQRRLEHLRD